VTHLDAAISAEEETVPMAVMPSSAPPGFPNLRSHAYTLCVVTPGRSTTSATLNPLLRHLPDRFHPDLIRMSLELIDSSAQAIFHGLEMSRKPSAIHLE